MTVMVVPLYFSFLIYLYLCSMKLKVKLVYDIVNDLLSKNNGVTLSPDEFNRYAELTSNALQDEYRGANTAQRSTIGRNRTLDARLLRQVVSDHAISTNGGGYAELPSDWIQTLTLRTIDYAPIKPIDEDRIAMAHQDPYTTPTEDNLIYEVTGTTAQFSNKVGVIKVHPTKARQVIMTYLRRPIPAVYGYKIVSNRAEYDANESVDFDWDSSQMGEIVFRILQLAGLSMDKGQVIQYAMAKQNEE